MLAQSLGRSRHLHVSCFALGLALLLSACGSEDQKAPIVNVIESDGGAPPAYPPALGPDDCATTTSKIKLSQPDGAAVWGGLTLLEFDVEGAKVQQFDVQAYDPALAAWTINYNVGVQLTGQRDDGSYFLAVSPFFTEDTKDQERKLRVRPSQPGCPAAEWTETATFTAGDPLLGTSWKAEIPAQAFAGQLNLERRAVPVDMLIDAPTLHFGDVTLSIEFGAKGVFSESIVLPVETGKGLPYDACTFNLGFKGTYQLALRQYGQIEVAISSQTLTSTKGTTCKLPKVADLAITQPDVMVELGAYQRAQVNINYLPTLYVEPAAPIWSDSGLGQLFQQLPQFLGYQTADERGSVNGSVALQELNFVRQ